MKFQKNNIVQIFIFLASTILILKAAQMQLFDDEYKSQVENVTLHRTWLFPGRGMIYDRNGKLLVKNVATYQLKFIFNRINQKMDTVKFCQLLGISIADFNKRMNIDWTDKRLSKNLPIVFMTNIDPENYNKFSEHLYEFPGFYTDIKSIRTYPYPNAAQILGYMGEVTKEKIENSDGDYIPGEMCGIHGLESKYEKELKGTKGVRYELKDNRGRILESYKGGKLDIKALSGSDMITSLDIDLQAFGEKLLQNKRGAIVAIDPKTGEILASVSSPTYDPNDLTIKLDRGKLFYNLLRDSINKPLLNRAIGSKYPPGSVFKPILSLIALQMGVTYSDRTIYCPGMFVYKTRYHTFRWKCHRHSVPQNISIAIEHSCNTYFLQLGREVIEKYGFSKPGQGLDTMAHYMNLFGLGRKTGVDMFNESKGFVPTNSYYESIYKKQHVSWRSTYVLSLGIGQGEFEFTTLQIANTAAAIANRGYYYTPHFIKSFKDNRKIDEKFTVKNYLGIDRSHFAPVIDGMELVVLSGTAPWAFVPGLNICGKTGTSENYAMVKGVRTKMKDNSVFMGFAPKENPKIAIAVYVENAGFGGDVAAPIGSLMIEKFLNNNISFYRKWLENRILNLDLIHKSAVYESHSFAVPDQDTLKTEIDTITQ